MQQACLRPTFPLQKDVTTSYNPCLVEFVTAMAAYPPRLGHLARNEWTHVV